MFFDCEILYTEMLIRFAAYLISNHNSMADLMYQGDFNKTANTVKIKLILIHFKDEKGVHFVYSPHLDITGYGMNLQEAKKSFEIVLDDFIDYTLEKKTLEKVLGGLGWKIKKGSLERPKKMETPSINTVIGNNKFVSDIFDKFPVNTFHQEVGLPALV